MDKSIWRIFARYYLMPFEKDRLDKHIRYLLINGNYARRVLNLLKNPKAQQLENWDIWNYYARYQVTNLPKELDKACQVIWDQEEEYEEDALALFILSRHGYQTHGNANEGLYYLRKAASLLPLKSWQSEYAILCYYSKDQRQAELYFRNLIALGYHRQQPLIFTLYMELLIQREDFIDALDLLRGYRLLNNLHLQDLVLFFKLEELYGRKLRARRMAKMLFYRRHELDDLMYALLMFYFFRHNAQRYLDKMYACIDSRKHPMIELICALYLDKYAILDEELECIWNEQSQSVHSFLDHTFLTSLSTHVILHRRTNARHKSAGELAVQYANFHQIWSRYGADIFFLHEKPMLSAQFVRTLYQLESHQYTQADRQLYTIALTYRTHFILAGSSRLPFGYFWLRAELAMRREQWVIASRYYHKALRKLRSLSLYYHEYMMSLIIMCIKTLAYCYAQYLPQEELSKRMQRLDIFSLEQLPFLIEQAQEAKENKDLLMSWLWQGYIENQLLHSKSRRYQR